MIHRIYVALVILCWLASMSWLVVAKIVPSMIQGDIPNYRADLQTKPEHPDTWRIKWNGTVMGHAASRVLRRPDGRAELRSIVQIDKLPLAAIAREMLGVMSVMAESLLKDARNLEMAMLVSNQMVFDQQQRLAEFRTTIEMPEMRSQLLMIGTVDDENRLSVIGTIIPEQGESIQAFQRSVHLPPDSTLIDSVAPRSKIPELKLGQRWTMPVYRAFPPNQPVEIIHATVERHDIILWDGGDVETRLIVYRADPGSQIQATREPVGREWVRHDGLVLRRELTFAGMQLRFERTDDEEGVSILDLLNAPSRWQHESAELPTIGN